MNKKEILDFYLSLGFSLIPLLPMEKRPCIESWAEYQRRKPTLDEIDKWFGNGKLEQRNYAPVCGKVSGNLVVLDFDNMEILKKIEGAKLFELIKKTLRVKTSKGVHVYFKSTVPIASGKRGYGLDIKSEGGYVVGAGSTHPDGKIYEFIGDVREIVTLDNIEELLAEVDTKFNYINKPIDDLKSQVAKELMGVGEGSRNNACVRIADFYIHYLKWTPEQTADFLINYWNKKNEPPLVEREIVSCVKSAEKRAYWTKKITDEVPLQAYGGPLLLAEYVLNQTIKSDRVNKLLTFLCELSAYTKDAQLNLLFKADSATGKSHIALKAADLFPLEDRIELAGASASSFFHEYGKRGCPDHGKEFDPECSSCREIIVELDDKILVFIDQPDDQLLDRLKPLLSHDRYSLTYKITDKTSKGSLRTKTVVLKGWPSVAFCTARINTTEEQSTRSFILSPQEDQEKLISSLDLITSQAKKTARQLQEELDQDPGRIALKEYIQNLKTHKYSIIVPDADKVLERFKASRPRLTARHQRDYKRLLNLIKVVAYFNMTDRVTEKDDKGNEVLYATEYDVELAFSLFDPISEANELGLSPSLLDFYTLILCPLWEQNAALEFRQVQMQFRALYRKPLNNRKLRDVILPPLEAAGLLYLDHDPLDRRKICVYRQNSNNNVQTVSKLYAGPLGGTQKPLIDTPHPPGIYPVKVNPEELVNKWLKSAPMLENDLLMKMESVGIPKGQTEKLISRLSNMNKIYQPKGGYWQAV